jgi:hypothetical protein
MSQSWKIGDVTVTKVVEMETVGGGEWILPDATPEAVTGIPWLIPDFSDAEGKLRFSIHALLVETPALTIVVDTCVGNDKERLPMRLWHQLQNDFLGDLATAGFDRMDVDVVPTLGHTPGHVSVRIRSGGAQALITGDFIHHPCQMARLDWASSADFDKAEAESTRRRVFAEHAETPTLIIGTHFSGATAGRVVRDGDAYRLLTQ